MPSGQSHIQQSRAGEFRRTKSSKPSSDKDVTDDASEEEIDEFDSSESSHESVEDQVAASSHKAEPKAAAAGKRTAFFFREDELGVLHVEFTFRR